MRCEERNEPRVNHMQRLVGEVKGTRQTSGWPKLAVLRAQVHGDLRGQDDVREECAERSRGGTECG